MTSPDMDDEAMTTNNTDGAAILPVTPTTDQLFRAQKIGARIAGPALTEKNRLATEAAILAIVETEQSHSLPGDVGTEKLRGLSERAAPAPWVVYSEPEVGLFASVFSGTVMETGFAPVNLDDPSNVEFIVEAVNFARAALSSPLPATQEDAERSGVGVSEPQYLIRKNGAYYRPNAAGYTTSIAEAGRYSLAEAIKHSHPNGPNGPRDGITYEPAPPTPQRQEYDGEAVREAEAWLRAISDWLLANDHDMALPSGILDTDPLDIADSLAALAHPAQATPSAVSGEQCQRCGHNNPPWSAPSPLWNAVMRGGSIDGEPKFDDMVCSACFMELAEQQGVASDWTVKARNVNASLETTTPSGRVWDDDKGLWVSAVSGEAGEAFKWIDEVLRYHETGGHEGDGSDYALRLAREELRLAALTPSALPSDWIASGIPDEAIEAGIEAWQAANHEMTARDLSATPEDMTDWDDGMVVAAIFKAVSRAMPGPSAVSGDAGEGE